MFIPKDDKLRHKILETLNTKTDNQKFRPEGIREEEWLMPIDELLEKTGISDEDYRRVNSLLFTRDEIYIKAYNGKEHIAIKDNGMTALNEKSYLKEGEEKTRKKIDFLLKFTAVFSLVLSTFNTYSSCNNQKADREKIQQLQQRINAIEGKAIPVPHK
jgi:hypothetical protein